MGRMGIGQHLDRKAEPWQDHKVMHRQDLEQQARLCRQQDRMVKHRLAKTWQGRKVKHQQDFGQQAKLCQQRLVRMQQVHLYQELKQQATLYRRHVVKHQDLGQQAELY